MQREPTSDAFSIGGDVPVRRLGFGAMQLTGKPWAWGEPADRPEAIRVLRRAVDLGVNLIDTADAYGPFIAEEIIREALFPYPEDLVIATKGGLLRPGEGRRAVPLGRPDYLRAAAEMSLRRLGVERIDLYQLHRIDPTVALEDQIGELVSLQGEGKIRHIGVSEVSAEELTQASGLASIATVQNLYNVSTRRNEDVLAAATKAGIGFIPWFPLGFGALAGPDSVLGELAEQHGATPGQLALAWLLQRSPVLLPIPGTSRVAHLEENMEARDIVLADADVAVLDSLGS